MQTRRAQISALDIEHILQWNLQSGLLLDSQILMWTAVEGLLANLELLLRLEVEVGGSGVGDLAC